MLAPSVSASQSSSLLCAADAAVAAVPPELSATSESAVRSAQTILHVNLTRLLTAHPPWRLSADGQVLVTVRVLIPEQQLPNPFGFASVTDLQAEASVRWGERLLTILIPSVPSLALDVDEALGFILHQSAIAVCPPASGVLVAALTVTAETEVLAAATRVATQVVSSSVAASSMIGGAGGGAAAADVQALAAFGLLSCAQPRDRNMLGNIRLLAPAAFTESFSGMLGGNIVLLCALGAIHSATVVVYTRRMRKKRRLERSNESEPKHEDESDTPLLHAMGLFHFPSLTLTVARLLHQGIACASAQLVSTSGSAWEVLFGCVGIVYTVLLVPACAVLHHRYVSVEFLLYDCDPTDDGLRRPDWRLRRSNTEGDFERAPAPRGSAAG